MTRTRSIAKLRRPDIVLNATVDQLVKQVNSRYDAVQSLTATVEIAASSNDTVKGEAKDFPETRGYILMRKPAMLRVIGLVPVLHTHAFDMVSDGNTFTLLISVKNRAITGSDAVSTPSKNVLENLRPDVFLDSMLVPGVSPDEFVSLTTDTRIVDLDPKRKVVIEEPDYNLTVTRRRGDSNEMIALRVIHISRTTLLPYQQDIYDDSGNIVTQAVYGPYQDYGGTQFPSTMTIRRPLEKYSVKLTMDRVRVNQPLDDKNFELKIPTGTQVQKLP
ncbi:MAG: outer membrane lipoprotein-sorting protein [Acidobacteriaceae bacterium]